MEKRELIRKEILYYIEKNSRANLGELAVLLGTDEVTVANEIAEMEKDKVICGYHTLIDWDKAGVELVTALIEVRMTPQRSQGFDKIAERICNYPEVHAVYLISGGYDLLVSLEGKTLKEVSQFVSEKLSDSVNPENNSSVTIIAVSSTTLILPLSSRNSFDCERVVGIGESSNLPFPNELYNIVNFEPLSSIFFSSKS